MVRIEENSKRSWLSHIRKNKGMTQEQVASSSFIDRSYYSQIESGKRSPGLNVAKNIAKVLNFDPLQFFKDDQNISLLEDTDLNKDIYERIKKLDSGRVVYLYSNYENYLQHAISFLLIGVSKNTHCFLIDNPDSMSQINKGLLTNLTIGEINKQIHFINLEDFKKPKTEVVVDHLIKIFKKMDDRESIYLWSHEQHDDSDNWICQLQKRLISEDIKLRNKKILIVCSNNAAIVSAGTHIKMMRECPYLMTDTEIVESPLYHSNQNSRIFPSLFIQENM
ncbi:helix-turn-helix transcriptional regulator [Neobacillus drentensis]|uniref:helix-turn-helix domain-containing protein n=1 Tax=Neobacillus drentensis TaxID=220684 RepID=UPI002FFE045B